MGGWGHACGCGLICTVFYLQQDEEERKKAEEAAKLMAEEEEGEEDDDDVSDTLPRRCGQNMWVWFIRKARGGGEMSGLVRNSLSRHNRGSSMTIGRAEIELTIDQDRILSFQ